MNRFEKCKFCVHYDDFEGCRKYVTMKDKKCFEANNDKIIATAEELGWSIADVVALISIN